MNRKIFLIILYTFLLTNFAKAQNQAGLPDLSFGTNGEVINPYRIGEIFTYFVDMKLQADGKTVVLGYTLYNIPEHSGFMLIRYNADGSLDSTFGNEGISDGMIGNFVGVKAMEIQADGKILVAGSGTFVNVDYSLEDFFIARFNSDGSLDTSFGVNGKVVTDFAEFEEESRDHVNTMILQPDGKIILAGRKNFSNRILRIGGDVPIIARYNSDGTLDNTFGSLGKTIIHLPEEILPPGEIFSVSLQTDGKIIISGAVTWFRGATYLETKEETFLGRLNQNGIVDISFATNGFYRTEGFYYQVKHKTLPNNKIILILGSRLILFNQDGGIDTQFSHKPPNINNYPPQIKSIDVQPNGKIIVSGQTASIGSPSMQDLCLARYFPNGKLDGTFGKGGFIIKRSLEFLEGRQIIIQPDGKILLGAWLSSQNRYYIYVARFLGDASSNAESMK